MTAATPFGFLSFPGDCLPGTLGCGRSLMKSLVSLGRKNMGHLTAHSSCMSPLNCRPRSVSRALPCPQPFSSQDQRTAAEWETSLSEVSAWEGEGSRDGKAKAFPAVAGPQRVPQAFQGLCPENSDQEAQREEAERAQCLHVVGAHRVFVD